MAENCRLAVAYIADGMCTFVHLRSVLLTSSPDAHQWQSSRLVPTPKNISRTLEAILPAKVYEVPPLTVFVA